MTHNPHELESTRARRYRVAQYGPRAPRVRRRLSRASSPSLGSSGGCRRGRASASERERTDGVSSRVASHGWRGEDGGTDLLPDLVDVLPLGFHLVDPDEQQRGLDLVRRDLLDEPAECGVRGEGQRSVSGLGQRDSRLASGPVDDVRLDRDLLARHRRRGKRFEGGVEEGRVKGQGQPRGLTAELNFASSHPLGLLADDEL